MPNHVATNLVVYGYQAYVAEFINATMKDYKEAPNLMCFLPMPDIYTVSPTYIVSEEEAVERNKNGSSFNDGKKQYITQNEASELMAKYGALNWYDWALENWGTKWGAYDVSPQWTMEEEEEGTVSAIIHYNTAWGPMDKYLLKVSEMFPTLTFFTEFADEGGGFVMTQEFKNGELVEECEFDWDSDEGIVIRERVGYYYPEDDEYEDEFYENSEDESTR